MVKRIVLWKIKNDQNKQTNLNIMREQLVSLKNMITEIVSLEVGLDYGTAAYDIVLIVAFNELHHVKQFHTHPEFQKIVQMSQAIADDMIACDFMIESDANSSMSMNNGANANGGFSTPNPGFNNNANGFKRDTLATSASPNDAAFSLPYNSNKADNKSPMGFNQNNGGAYNGFGGLSSNNKNGVNFTTSENVNQLKFQATSSIGVSTPMGASSNMGMSPPIGGSSPMGGPMVSNPPVSGPNMGGNTPALGNNDSWRCTKCGKTNSSFINMCSCGKRKPDTMAGMPGMNPANIDKRMLQPPQNGMMSNTGLVPKLPTSPINNTFANKMGNNNSANNWICPSCGKSNNDFMKVCVCGHRKVEKGSSPALPAYGNSNNGVNNSPMMPLPKNAGANNIKSPNNNEFFNSFGGNQGMNNGANNRPLGGPGNIGGPGGPGNIGGPGGPGGMNRPMGGGPGGPGGPMLNNQMKNPNPPFSNRPPSPGGPPKNMTPTPPDSWKCPRCGKVLGNFVGQCICGQRKPSRTNMQF